MMPGVGFAEMILLALVAIVVIGPKDLPLMMRKFGRFTGKMRSLAFEFQQGIDELGRQAELEELRKEVMDLKRHTGIEDFTKELEQDRINMEKDIASAMAPVEVKPPVSMPAPAAVLGVAAAGAEPPAAVAPPVEEAVVDDEPPVEGPPPPSALEALAVRQSGVANMPRHGNWPRIPKKNSGLKGLPRAEAMASADPATAPGAAGIDAPDADVGFADDRAAKQDTSA